MPSLAPLYRLAVDDVIYSFRDLTQRQPASLFDSPFLGMLREIHRTYGAKITLNLFYQTHEGDFSLEEFPARYRSEWQENAAWLRLAFHARQEFPDRAYAGPELVAFARDYYDIRREVMRFAGPESWTPPCLIHFCTIPEQSLKTLAGWGVRNLAGLFFKTDTGWDIDYGLSPALAERAARNEQVLEEASGITFSRVDLVINNCPLEQIPAELERGEGTPARARKIDLLTHEQYSWPFYPAFIPEHAERIAAACRWCVERGYQPAFFNA